VNQRTLLVRKTAMQTVKQDQLWDVLRGGEWCRARVINVISDRVNLHLFKDDNSATGNTATVTLGEMKDSAKFRFVADRAEPPA
jgi:hypothetical protein